MQTLGMNIRELKTINKVDNLIGLLGVSLRKKHILHVCMDIRVSIAI